MSGKLTRAAYESMIDENIAWLHRQPKTTERDHIETVLRASIEEEYPDSSRSPGCSTRKHDILTNADLTTLRRWARQLEGMKHCFPDDRAYQCEAASNLLFSITTKR